MSECKEMFAQWRRDTVAKEPNMDFVSARKGFEACHQFMSVHVGGSQYETMRVTEWLNDYREKAIRLETRLKEAEGVIEFYGDADNYKSRHGGYVYNAMVSKDMELSFKGSDEHFAGKRAREYMNKYASTTFSS